MCHYMKNLGEDRSVRFMGARERRSLLSKWERFSKKALFRLSNEGSSDGQARCYIVYGSHTPAFCIFPNRGHWKVPFTRYSYRSTYTFSAVEPLQGPFLKCTPICSIMTPFFSDSKRYEWPYFLQPSHFRRVHFFLAIHLHTRQGGRPKSGRPQYSAVAKIWSKLDWLTVWASVVKWLPIPNHLNL
jgi:hypothetical protein